MFSQPRVSRADRKCVVFNRKLLSEMLRRSQSPQGSEPEWTVAGTFAGKIATPFQLGWEICGNLINLLRS